MSDGGRESGTDNQTSSKKSKVSGGDEFGRAIAKIAVTQICGSTGFHSSHPSALDALADVAIRYISDLGKAANFYANLSGRTSSNVFDVIQGLEDLGLSQGFSGASDIHRCLASSGVVREIGQFVNTAEEVPFAWPVPRFPIARIPKQTSSFAQIGEAPAGNHIPNWLPAFPDPHTYIHTPVWNERATDLRTDKIEQARQRRKAERSLLSLQQRLACNATAEFMPAIDGDAGKGKEIVTNNPFLAPPLPYGEKEVSEIVMPKVDADEKKLSVLETFAPAIEAAKNGSLTSLISEERVLPSERPMVHFKFGIHSKSIVAPLSSKAQNAKTDSWFLRDDEKDDKKRRAEMILKEAMENPQELAQL
ncbi:transcription initiation factor TFIID subunit 8 [Elaeis guineensis]|uniref:Transcription initiation factor TFIID subunit 8 n=1 Tax=Elaeis guineensis var. tenera TaxID=51953 RepID=A0A6I9S5X5_ELAGV|nr:transcription initiation factor TFIID subunit 8 [Elaeis guineensis]XP_029124211.1 transcription initiation factor TFIID subunit 8 [Elaeis guineensis]